MPIFSISLGVFFTALATLMLEILLTRVFSVTMWYHFAFMAVSVAMFGMTVGALIVYLLPQKFPAEQTIRRMAWSSYLFALTTVISFGYHIAIPAGGFGSPSGLIQLASTYAVIAVPFICSGICICLALTRFPNAISRLYAADLAGGAFGCLLFIAALQWTKDGPATVLVVAGCASLAAFFLARALRSMNFQIVSAGTALLFLTVATLMASDAISGNPWIALRRVKGQIEDRQSILHERWNSFSRITVSGDPNQLNQPFSWTISKRFPAERRIRQLVLKIDATAATPITAFDGDLRKIEHLRFDAVNMAHQLRQDADVLVVGVGGGRDLLSALAFGQKSVTGVEINPEIIEAVNGRYGEFTGHLDQRPDVTVVRDEARSFVAASDRRFDIIQVSFIDTWAATAAGAFALTESSLYTVEAWQQFLDHLNQRGILSFCRWYFRDRPGEVYRLTSLAAAVLHKSGITEPRRHVMILRQYISDSGQDRPDGVGTVLVSKRPFTAADIATFERIAQELGFTVVLTPERTLDPVFTHLLSGGDLEPFLQEFPINIAPPTDNSPYFFHMLRLPDIFRSELWQQGEMSFNMKAVFVLGVLIATVTVLTGLCIIVPLMLTRRDFDMATSWPYFVYFMAIGFGYMLIEISQMQRLNLFLGHPLYGLAVVLFAFLLSSGAGSYCSQWFFRAGADKRRSGSLFFAILLAVTAILGVFTHNVLGNFQALPTALRIAIAIATILPIGFFMGMAFPLGMQISTLNKGKLTPWLWGINGASSVWASVLAVAISLSASIPMAFWIGVFCYSIAFGSFFLLSRVQAVPE